MNPWITNPVWQNFSSLFREAITAQEAKTGMERSHHLTASLYFGIAALEAFLNQKMRDHLQGTKSEKEIFNALRNGKVIEKIKKWPEKLLGKPLNLSGETINSIVFFNDVRGDLTHPKTQGHSIYAKLEKVDPISVIDTVSEYIVHFHETEGTSYPYWLFGWNYLNPRPDSYEIILINDQQFMFSLQALGFKVQAALYAEAEVWRDHYLKTFEGFLGLKRALSSLQHCEPKIDRFPYRPILCRRWWVPEHHRSCGYVTEEALDYARNYGVIPIHKPDTSFASRFRQILSLICQISGMKKLKGD
jgi:hypothetical protein